MSLTTEKRREKLLECETGKDFHSLYELVFGEIVPETVTRNPNEELENIIPYLQNLHKARQSERDRNYKKYYHNCRRRW